jgi:carboxyl-terminal processing protease
MLRVRKLAIVILMTGPVFAGAVYAQQTASKDSVYEELNLFDEAFERVRQDAVDPVSDAKLIGAAIAGMLSGLDPHSSFMDAEEFKSSQAPAGEDTANLGLAVTIENGQLKVISPQDGSPAARAGITPGDVIYSIDNEPTYDLTLGEAEQKLRGPSDSEVSLTLRRDAGNPIDLKIKREPYTLQTVVGRVEGGNIGYIRIAGFDAGTAAALADTVQDLRRKIGGKPVGFILDLRNNPGGTFDAAVAAADAFLDKGDVVVIKGRKPGNTKRIAATPGDLAKGLPLVALVNGGTAHEAELVAGALQDNHRAVLIGAKTFGESSIESVIPLAEGGAIRLTTARFTTPSGREIQGKGLDPDLVVTPLRLAKLEHAEGRREADLPGALKNPDKPAAGGATPPADQPPAAGATSETPSVPSEVMGSANDEQLTEAVDVLRGLSLAGRRASG